MCMASSGGFRKLLSKAYMNSPGQKLRDEIAKNDPMSRWMGYEAGLADPLGNAMARMGGTKSRQDVRAARIGEQQATAQRDANYKEKVYSQAPAHARSIAARKGG